MGGPAYDVVVAGAGIVGSAVAMACAERGARVLVVDRGDPGGKASNAAAGLLAPASEAHAQGPFLDAARASLELWPELAERLVERSGIDCELVLDGLLRVALDPADATAVRAGLTWQQAAGVDGAWLDSGAVATLEPALPPGHVGAALYRGEGHVHSPRAVRALGTAVLGLGGARRAGEGVDGVGRGGTLRLDGGELVRTAVLVLAAGCWSGRTAAALGLPPLPVRPVRGQLIALRDLPRLPGHVIYAGPRGYAVAKRNGLLLIGATEEDAGFDAQVTPEATRILLDRAIPLVAGAGQATLAAAWAGLRPATPDLLPLVGDLGSLPGGMRVLVAAGHHRNGVLLAPLTGWGVATAALDGPVPGVLAAFDPRRFL